MTRKLVHEIGPVVHFVQLGSEKLVVRSGQVLGAAQVDFRNVTICEFGVRGLSEIMEPVSPIGDGLECRCVCHRHAIRTGWKTTIRKMYGSQWFSSMSLIRDIRYCDRITGQRRGFLWRRSLGNDM